MIACLFGSRADAEAARDCLLKQGFEDARIRLEGSALAQSSTADGHANDPASAHSVGPSRVGVIERMFSGLLPDSEVTHYAHAVSNGKFVVVLHVEDDAAAARAASILHEFGGKITSPTGSGDEVVTGATSSVARDTSGYAPRTQVGVAAAVSGPRIYPLANSPTGWNKASEGSKNSIGDTMNDPGRPEGLLRDAEGLGVD